MAFEKEEGSGKRSRPGGALHSSHTQVRVHGLTLLEGSCRPLQVLHTFHSSHKARERQLHDSSHQAAQWAVAVHAFGARQLISTEAAWAVLGAAAWAMYGIA